MRHGSQIDPPNRFERVRSEPDYEHLEWDTEYLAERNDRRIEYIADESQSIISENSSPDVPFRYSLNPYRGCIHSCSYCYARPGHEFLGLNAGLDFETKIIVKHDAPDLFRRFLSKKSWRAEPIMFSGVTDCYQPAERRFRLTRGCLEVASECRQAIDIITKNALVLRDLDMIRVLARDRLVHVFVSITTLDVQLARAMEPRTSIPSARLRAVRTLADAGVPVGVMVAPVIPGLNDSEIPSILQAATQAGAAVASYVLLRLPLTVEPVFKEWLQRTQPERAEKVLSRIQETRAGKLSDSTWGRRMVGSGELAGQIGNMFAMFKKKYGLNQPLPPHDCGLFTPPAASSGQLRLF